MKSAVWGAEDQWSVCFKNFTIRVSVDKKISLLPRNIFGFPHCLMPKCENPRIFSLLRNFSNNKSMLNFCNSSRLNLISRICHLRLIRSEIYQNLNSATEMIEIHVF